VLSRVGVLLLLLLLVAAAMAAAACVACAWRAQRSPAPLLVQPHTRPHHTQVVRKALDEGYEVRCIVKPRNNPADFLRDWGATTVQVRVGLQSFVVGVAVWSVRRTLPLLQQAAVVSETHAASAAAAPTRVCAPPTLITQTNRPT
jgi:hypothetical protein